MPQMLLLSRLIFQKKNGIRNWKVQAMIQRKNLSFYGKE